VFDNVVGFCDWSLKNIGLRKIFLIVVLKNMFS
jgi:hypothetical protein